MRQREIQISEREAYEAYVLHLKALAPGCGCKPCEGILCPKGARRHAAWRAAAEAEAELGEAVARGLDLEVRNATPRDELFLRLDSAGDEE